MGQECQESAHFSMTGMVEMNKYTPESCMYLVHLHKSPGSLSSAIYYLALTGMGG